MLRCSPAAGSSTNPAARLPATAPAVFARYRVPARRPTAVSVRWITALASGNANPISSAGSATSASIGLALNQSSARAPVPATAAALIGSTSAAAKPYSVEATKSPCASISHSAGRPVRRCTAPPTSAPAPMPSRMSASSSEKTARNPPSRIVKWRNQRISMPSAARPDSTSARLVSATARVPPLEAITSTPGTTSRLWGGPLRPAWRGVKPRPTVPGVRLRYQAPAPASTFNPTAISCVDQSPHAGTSAKSVSAAPVAAPSVLMPYSSAIRQPPMARSLRTRCRMRRVSVPPISRVIGVRSAMAIAARARYEPVESTYHPDASRTYDETSADTASRCGSAAAIASPSAAIAIST